MNYKSIDFNILIKSLVLLITICEGVYGHGRLVDPPSRSSAWRYGFKTERNYNDQELFCGGFTVSDNRCDIKLNLILQIKYLERK